MKSLENVLKGDGRDSFSRVILGEIPFFMQKIEVCVGFNFLLQIFIDLRNFFIGALIKAENAYLIMGILDPFSIFFGQKWLEIENNTIFLVKIDKLIFMVQTC